MKKIRNIMLILLILFTKNVNAVCDYAAQAKLNSEAATVKAIYEEQLGKFDSSYTCNDGQSECEGYYYFKISILNLSENFYVTVKGDNNFSKTFNYSDVKDGIVSFDIKDIMDTHTFTFDVYSSSASSCPDKKTKTFYLTTPRYNEFYDYGFCQDNQDYYLCDKYVTFEKMETTEFMKKYDEYIDGKQKAEEEKNKNFFQKLGEFIKEHKEIFIGAGCTILVVGGVVVFLQVKKRKDII